MTDKSKTGIINSLIELMRRLETGEPIPSTKVVINDNGYVDRIPSVLFEEEEDEDTE